MKEGRAAVAETRQNPAGQQWQRRLGNSQHPGAVPTSAESQTSKDAKFKPTQAQAHHQSPIHIPSLYFTNDTRMPVHQRP